MSRIYSWIGFAVIFVGMMPVSSGCQNTTKNTQQAGQSTQTGDIENREALDSAYFASGCFWCVESIYEHVKGVPEAISGFAGGQKVDPSYREVASGATDHAETVKVYFDPDKVSFQTLVDVYYGTQDPTTVGQDPDFGSQYRSIIFYTNPEQKAIAKKAKKRVAKQHEQEVKTTIKPLKAFYPASAYHQDYERKNPNDGYIRQVSKPRLKGFKKAFPELVEHKTPWKP